MYVSYHVCDVYKKKRKKEKRKENQQFNLACLLCSSTIPVEEIQL